MRFQKGNTIWKGKSHTEKTKQKMSEGHKGKNNAMYGKQHSEETRKKMIEAHKGKHLSEKTKRKISKAHWKGGKRNYYQKLSRKIWEEYHNRKIPKGHIVHHKDENWKNIDPENLELMASRSVHTKYHRNLKNNKEIK